jgi:hypothetical protein
MRLTNRLVRLEHRSRERPHPDAMWVVQAVPVSHANGRPLGLYRDGPPGSLAGVLVYDPAEGPPALPIEGSTAAALLVVCDPDAFTEPL